MTNDGLEPYRDIAEQHRQGIRDPRRLTAAFAVSVAGLVVVVALLLTVCRPRP
ncbi:MULTISPECIES: hypothetical protein [unclassified Kitasatospora]|uniref:hypothetical protein n=1 Tax=unclassified Kitasatospora TaxID=2633591 RepID=UPI001ADF83B0|nr:hypothetical protein [Kitasatospora sp. RG8]MBP0449064.1 hypothetical protein [Kitasatospora sp. RG8]